MERKQCHWTDACQGEAEAQCPWCQHWYCAEHVVMVAIYKREYAEETLVCALCLALEFEALERRIEALQEDGTKEEQRVRELQAQLRRRELEKEALRRQVRKMGGKPCA